MQSIAASVGERVLSEYVPLAQVGQPIWVAKKAVYKTPVSVDKALPCDPSRMGPLCLAMPGSIVTVSADREHCYLLKKWGTTMRLLGKRPSQLQTSVNERQFGTPESAPVCTVAG